MPYKCRACGNVQDYNGPCNGLMHPGGWYDNMMDMVESNQRLARDLNIEFYGDGGCCGCNRKKRRIMMFVIAIAAVIAAGGWRWTIMMLIRRIALRSWSEEAFLPLQGLAVLMFVVVSIEEELQIIGKSDFWGNL